MQYLDRSTPDVALVADSIAISKDFPSLHTQYLFISLQHMHLYYVYIYTYSYIYISLSADCFLLSQLEKRAACWFAQALPFQFGVSTNNGHTLTGSLRVLSICLEP